MYCGLCAEVCPTGSIGHCQEFEGASYDPIDMIKKYTSFVKPGELFPPYRRKKGGETDQELAKKVEPGNEFMDLFAQPEQWGRGEK